MKTLSSVNGIGTLSFLAQQSKAHDGIDLLAAGFVLSDNRN